MLTKITLALAFAFAVIYAVPASAESQNLRVQHGAVRQLGHLDWSLLRLGHVGKPGEARCQRRRHHRHRVGYLHDDR